MNLVVGATGMVGTEICRLIAASGKPVKALVRASSDAAKVENLKRLGATVVQGDLRDRISLKGFRSDTRPCRSIARATGRSQRSDAEIVRRPHAQLREYDGDRHERHPETLSSTNQDGRGVCAKGDDVKPRRRRTPQWSRRR